MLLVAKERAADLERLTGLIEDGKVVPSVDRSYPLDEAPDAMRLLEKGQVRGKVVITVSTPSAWVTSTWRSTRAAGMRSCSRASRACARMRPAWAGLVQRSRPETGVPDRRDLGRVDERLADQIEHGEQAGHGGETAVHGPEFLTNLASKGGAMPSNSVTAAAPRVAVGHRARNGAGRASSSLAASSRTAKMIKADPSIATASRCGRAGQRRGRHRERADRERPSISVASMTNTRT